MMYVYWIKKLNETKFNINMSLSILYIAINISHIVHKNIRITHKKT